MGVSVKYLHQPESGGRLEYRRVFPPNLRPYIPGKPTQLKRSLGSAVYDERAAAAFLKAVAEYDRTVALATKAASGAFDPIDALTSRYVAELYRAREMAKDASARAAGLPPVAAGESSQNEVAWDGLTDAYEQAQANPKLAVEWFGEDVKAVAVGAGKTFDASSPEFRGLCLDVFAVALEVANDRLRKDAGKYVPLAAVPVAPVPAVSIDPAASGAEPMSKTITAILSRPGAEAGASTAQTTQSALRTFIEVHGDIPLAEVRKHHVSQWLDLLRQKPAKVPYAERLLSLGLLVSRYQGRDVPRLTGKTISTQVQSLAAAWNKVRKAGYLPEGTRRDDNPFAEHEVAITHRSEPKGFSAEELNAIFALPVFTKRERPVRGRGEAAFWMPLILLWTGARPEEVAQLLVGDVRHDPELNRWTLTYTDEGEHPYKGKRTLKTAKTNSGRRTIPLPAELIRLGFIAYVESLKAGGEVALFPRLRTKASGRKELNASWAGWWGGYLREHGILGAAGSGRQPAREFRHTWTTAARRSGLNAEEREYIQGHSTAGKSANVGYGAGWEAIAAAIDRVQFKGLDLSRVRWSEPQP